MKTVVLIGAGGHSKVVIETILDCNNNYEIVLLDDIYNENNPIDVFGFPIIGKFEKIYEHDFQMKYKEVVVALGSSNLRIKWLKSLMKYGYSVPSFVHPSAFLSKSSTVGKGTIILAKSVIQANVKLGDGIIVNSSAIIEHDVEIGLGTHVCPGVTMGGNVKIGSCSWIGIGSTIKENLCIGSNVIIGAGSVVLNDISDNSIVFGVPASTKK